MVISEKQKTIARKVSFSGKALQTGEEVKVECMPVSASNGITFQRTDIPRAPLLKIGKTALPENYLRRSVIGKGRAVVQTVEHFMAALWGLGIDNISVLINGPELPALDGSAIGFMSILKNAGLSDLDYQKTFVEIKEEINIAEGPSYIVIAPHNGFHVSYLIDYPCKSIGKDSFSVNMDSVSFEKEIAPARTFCLKKEAELLRKAGLGGGATTENTLVMDDDGPMGGTRLRFNNEPLRHKILDIVGDLYLLGVSLRGKVSAVKSGHKLNRRLVRAIYERYLAKKGEKYE